MITTSVNLVPEAPVAEMIELAQLAEQCGYDRCWVYDEGLATRDVYIVMTAIALATKRIAVGTGITNPYTRHPGIAAATTATIDELSGGRAFLGLGAGGSLTLDPLGIARTQPLARVREAIETCRRVFNELDYARSDIEIWLAGRGPKMLRLGGELADGVALDFIHKELLGDVVATIGSKPALCYSTAIVTGGSFDAIRPHMTYRLVDSQPHVKERIGITPHDVDAIRTAMSGGLEEAAVFVRDEWVEPFVIAGNASECAGELGELMDRHGISEFMLPVLDHGAAASDISETAEVLASL